MGRYRLIDGGESRVPDPCRSLGFLLTEDHVSINLPTTTHTLIFDQAQKGGK